MVVQVIERKIVPRPADWRHGAEFRKHGRPTARERGGVTDHIANRDSLVVCLTPHAQTMHVRVLRSRTII